MIEWCDLTLNPVVGCSKCSPGCDNCYAERFAARLSKNPLTAKKYAGIVNEAGKWTGKVNIDFDCFYKLPSSSKRIFIGSMTDIFLCDYNAEFFQQSWIPELLETVEYLDGHVFMILTKRPVNMKDWIDAYVELNLGAEIENLWLGVTVCNQAEADAKIPILLATPAAKRFVSVEPMLGPVNLSRYICKSGFLHADECGTYGPECEQIPDPIPFIHMRDPWVRGLDWVICGGETGPNARPMHPDWVRSLRDHCSGFEVPFFFKGWGELYPVSQFESASVRSMYAQNELDNGFIKIGKKRSGRLLDGREYSQVPE